MASIGLCAVEKRTQQRQVNRNHSNSTYKTESRWNNIWLISFDQFTVAEHNYQFSRFFSRFASIPHSSMKHIFLWWNFRLVNNHVFHRFLKWDSSNDSILKYAWMNWSICTRSQWRLCGLGRPPRLSRSISQPDGFKIVQVYSKSK